jgi:response regulator NasT
MRVAIVDESATRAAVIGEGFAALEDCEVSVITERRGLVARMAQIDPISC